jgi:small subunit ribosomal protein S1
MSEEILTTTTEQTEESTDTTANAAAAEPVETMADYEDAINASFRRVQEGDLLTGTVIGVSDDEVILDFGSYTDGVIKLADASDDPSFTFQEITVGQQITATVIRRDNGEGRIQLSMKEASAVLGWDRLEQLLADQSNITVRIAEAVKSGVTTFVEGIRGFIPASKLSLTYVEDLDAWVGREIEVRVITADREEKRLVLSAKEILREKAAEERKQQISNVEVGLVTEGTVETLQPYGAFVNLGHGLSGLLHVSQISQQRIKHPGAVLKEGQTVKVKIIGVKDGKISLSMKALEDVAAETIEEEVFEMPEAEAATTSLASLFKNIKL